MRSASSARNFSASRYSSRALAGPTMRGNDHVPPKSPDNPAGAGEDDGAHVLIGGRVLQRFSGAGQQVGAHRVEVLGPVEGDGGDRTVDFVLHRLVHAATVGR